MKLTFWSHCDQAPTAYQLMKCSSTTNISTRTDHCKKNGS